MVVYTHADRNGISYGFGNVPMSVSGDITSKTIREMEDKLKSDAALESCVILNLIELDGDT